MKLALTLLSLALLATAAGAATVDFNSFSPTNTCLATVSDGGLDFANNGSLCTGVWVDNPNGNGTPSYILGFSGYSAITQTGGGAFNLNNFDMAISWYSAASSTTVDVTAWFQGGGSSTTTLTLIPSIQTYTLNLANVTEVDITALASGDGYWLLDNVNYSTTPEPGTLALLGSGMLAGVGVLRRKLML